jgi:hypothetical protein
LTLLTLPNEVKMLIREHSIGYDAAQRLYRIRDTKKQIEVAQAMAGMTSHKQREIISYAVRNPRSDLNIYRRRVEAPNVTRQKIHVVVLPLPERVYKALLRRGAKNKISPEKIILDIVNNWIERGS